MIKCLIGGGHHLSDDLADINAALSHYIKPTDKLLVIPFAVEETGYERWMQSITHNYQKLGITDYNLIRYSDSTDSMLEAIQSADVIFLAGGWTERLLQRVHDKGLVDALHQFNGVLIGYSAGALAMSQAAITTADDHYPEMIVEKGLGFVDFSVEVHYTGRVDGDLSTLDLGHDIYLLPDGGAVLVDHDNHPHFINITHKFSGGHKRPLL